MSKQVVFNVRPELESLEDRRVLSTASIDAGVINVRGTAAADRVEVRRVGEGGDARIVVLDRGRQVMSVDADRVDRVRFNGLGGNDVFVNRSWRRAVVNGGGGADRLYLQNGDRESPHDPNDYVVYMVTGGSGSGGTGKGGKAPRTGVGGVE